MASCPIDGSPRPCGHPRGLPQGALLSNGNPARILDLLSIDGQWWTLANLADRFDLSPNSTLQALRRLERLGLVRRRQVPGQVETSPVVRNGHVRRRGYQREAVIYEWRAS